MIIGLYCSKEEIDCFIKNKTWKKVHRTFVIDISLQLLETISTNE
jgi:hypothetical protein